MAAAGLAGVGGRVLEGRVVGGDRAGLGGEPIEVEVLRKGPEELLEGAAEARVLRDEAQEARAGGGHLQRALEDPAGLGPEAVRAPVPGEPALARQVPEGGGVAGQGDLALAARAPVREAEPAVVAGGTGGVPVA